MTVYTLKEELTWDKCGIKIRLLVTHEKWALFVHVSNIHLFTQFFVKLNGS